MKRLVFLIAFLTIIMLITVYSLEFKAAIGFITDPPSIHNTGPGGFSTLVQILKFKGFKIISLNSIAELYKDCSPKSSILVIASPDKPLSYEDSQYITSWISDGGLAIVLDEIGSVDVLIDRLGIETLNYTIRDVDYAVCSFGELKLWILVNVYRPIVSIPENAKAICRLSRGTVIAIHMDIGAGKLLLFTDSSIFINYMFQKVRSRIEILLNSIESTYFGNRSIICFYEGGWINKYLSTTAILKNIVLFPYAVISWGISIVYRDLLYMTSTMKILSALFISILVTTIISIQYLVRKQFLRSRRRPETEVSKEILIGVVDRCIQLWKKRVKR